LPVCWPHFIYIYFSSVHVKIYKMWSQRACKTLALNNVQAAYFCKICIWLAASQMQISFSRLPAGWKFHAVSRPVANFIQSATSRMQIATG
jgi:hypothetical protein